MECSGIDSGIKFEVTALVSDAEFAASLEHLLLVRSSVIAIAFRPCESVFFKDPVRSLVYVTGIEEEGSKSY
ncbi:hypothetical protein [Prochlorococcus sp. MIT 1300]|uniref:hypothetical protein n=1 Tax=Prochlorococcus sp. MIT 1300 TaxID=3096218 RepID=UPI002A759248|nr:hypothetical protein [Prochlorococcus sp. MIT 1300]